MKKRLFALALCLCLFCTLLVPAAAAAGGEVAGYNQARNGVAVVATYEELVGYGATPVSFGSCFFVGEEGKDPEYLITNHHVVEEYLAAASGQVLGIKDEEGNTYAARILLRVHFDEDTYISAQVVDYNESADLALLRLEKPTDQRVPLTLCIPTSDMVGTTVHALGFPGISDDPQVAGPTSQWGLEDMTVTTGTIGRLFTESGTAVRQIQTDTGINHGNSGGPLVTDDGYVVGINTRGRIADVAQGEMNYAVNIDEAITILKRNGVPFIPAPSPISPQTTEEPVPEPTPGPGPTPTFPVIWAVVAALAVIAVVVAVVLIMKRKSAAAKQPAYTAPSGPAAAPSFPPTAPAVPAVSAASSNAGADDSGFRIQGVSGTLNGQRFMLRKSSPVVLGRDPQRCNVAFPANTPGVSGRHCGLWVQDGKVFLQDLGSSHGTYIQPGTRLAGNQAVELHTGDVFYLGSPKESFTIAVKGGK